MKTKSFTLRPLVLGLFAAAGLSASAQLDGELGILDTSANGGNNPLTGSPWELGDQYRLLFLTSATTDATSSDIETYNEFVQGVADAADLGGTWKVVASTEDVDAIDNTATDPATEVGVPVFLMDGSSLVAINNEELWNGIEVAPSLDETGTVVTENIDRVYTGSEANGRKVANGRTLGGDFEDKVRTGRADFAGGRWMRDFNVTKDQQRRVFALSEPLTVGGSSGGGITITGVDFAPETSTLSLTWTSSEASTYQVSYSLDLQTWDAELDDGVPADPGETTTREFDLSGLPDLEGVSQLFFRVERND